MGDDSREQWEAMSPSELLIVKLWLSNINKCLTLKFLEENLIHLYTTERTSVEATSTSEGKMTVRRKIPLGILIFLVSYFFQ